MCPFLTRSFPSQQIALLRVLPGSLEFSMTVPVPAALTALGLSILDTKHMYVNPTYYSQSWIPTPSLPNTFEFGIIFLCCLLIFCPPKEMTIPARSRIYFLPAISNGFHFPTPSMTVALFHILASPVIENAHLTVVLIYMFYFY